MTDRGDHERSSAPTSPPESLAARLDHVMFAGFTHPPAVLLAERLVARAPPGLSRVFYSDNGSTAIEVALKMVWQRWVHAGAINRKVFITLRGSYHGDTVGAMSVGDPDPYFLPFQGMTFSVERAERDADDISRRLSRLGDRAAGVIMEPLVQGAAGMIFHPPALVRAVREACDRHGVPMIADEVMTGFGRTGTLFACEQAGITPDYLCLSKGLTGGTLPLAATLAREESFVDFLSDDRTRAFFHGHTYTGNPIACAAALASLELVDAEHTPIRLDAIGRRIEAALRNSRTLATSHASNLRRVGGIVALDLPVAPADRKGSSLYFAGDALTLRRRAIDLGVLLRPLGPVLYAMPPSCTTDAQCDRIAEVMIELASTRDA